MEGITVVTSFVVLLWRKDQVGSNTTVVHIFKQTTKSWKVQTALSLNLNSIQQEKS